MAEIPPDIVEAYGNNGLDAVAAAGYDPVTGAFIGGNTANTGFNPPLTGTVSSLAQNPWLWAVAAGLSLALILGISGD